MVMRDPFASMAIPLCVFAAALSCGDGGGGDPFPTPTGNPLGGGLRLSEVQNPDNGYKDKVVDVTGVTVLAVDNYDETSDGKSRGTVFCQDFGATGPQAGLSGI